MKHKRKKLIILSIFAVLVLTGILWQFIMNQKEYKEYSAIGTMIDLESYQAQYYVRGEGSTAFIFITGSGTPCAYTDFYELQNTLSQYGQTIAFDHAGSGFSSDTKVPRTIKHLEEELALLIDSAAPNKNIVLICHSLGSLEAIAYAQNHKDKVVGLIALDSGSPQFYQSDSEVKAKLLNRGTAFLRTTGWNRFLGELGLLLPFYGENIRNKHLPDDLKHFDKIMYYRNAGNRDTLDTIKHMNENAELVAAGPTLGDLPLLVLSSDSGKEWQDVQLQLADWSTNSSQFTIKNSSHYLYWSNYDEVVSYIKSFIEQNHWGDN